MTFQFLPRDTVRVKQKGHAFVISSINEDGSIHSVSSGPYLPSDLALVWRVPQVGQIWYAKSKQPHWLAEVEVLRTNVKSPFFTILVIGTNSNGEEVVHSFTERQFEERYTPIPPPPPAVYRFIRIRVHDGQTFTSSFDTEKEAREFATPLPATTSFLKVTIVGDKVTHSEILP